MSSACINNTTTLVSSWANDGSLNKVQVQSRHSVLRLEKYSRCFSIQAVVFQQVSQPFGYEGVNLKLRDPELKNLTETHNSCVHKVKARSNCSSWMHDGTNVIHKFRQLTVHSSRHSRML